MISKWNIEDFIKICFSCIKQWQNFSYYIIYMHLSTGMSSVRIILLQSICFAHISIIKLMFTETVYMICMCFVRSVCLYTWLPFIVFKFIFPLFYWAKPFIDEKAIVIMGKRWWFRKRDKEEKSPRTFCNDQIVKYLEGHKDQVQY